METEKRDIRLQLFFMLVVLTIGLAGGYKMAKNHFRENTKMVTDTLIVEHWDTVKIVEPHEVVRYVQRYDTIRLTDEPRIVITIDSTAIVPIEQAVYSDSTENAQYTAYVSGFRAELDSIQINCKNTETVITNTIEIKPRRFGVGLQLGVGVSPQGVAAPYFGVGVHYRLW
ncbi:MAG: hypothetical protein J6T12_03195 [Salinivirgaceae bacterium]|nr:hypothetical protein [Salinivirgaceae bacterium]